jgi:nucleoside phosphorylase
MAAPTRTHQDYQIGIICALAFEKAAVEIMLDEEHPRLKRKEHDENDYTLGQIGDHNVAIACLPAGLAGNGAAAAVAKDMRRSFPIEFGLMVGVGGGVWSKRVDVRVGDVVVSHPEGTHGGVVQYDFGKMEQGGVFRRTGTLNKPPHVLLQALQSMKARHHRTGARLNESALKLLGMSPYMADTFGYPGADQDQLFQATFGHEGGETCDQCDIQKMVARPSRTDSAPRIHYGNIASGNQLMEDGVTRDELAQALGVICFEMEAAGLMDNFPCLVIRGICDYADSHRNKKWQLYAAVTAAALAGEILKFIDKQEAVNGVG